MLPPGAVVGTSSPRRVAQLTALRSDLRYESLRGNVDTRLRKLAAGEYDAIVIAMAGLNRLRAAARHVVPFEADRVVPAVGQGALAVETRYDDHRFDAVLRDAVNDVESELCVACERAALSAIGAGCGAPLGIHARLAGGTMTVAAFFASDATISRARIARPIATIDEARSLGAELAHRLTANDAAPSGVGR